MNMRARSERGSVKAWVLAFVIAASAGFGALVGIGCAIGANACLFVHHKPLTTTDGRSIWLADCAVCHGIEARGTDRAPSLVSGEGGSLDPEELQKRIGRGRPFKGMPAFKRELTAQQIESVARYATELRRTP